MSLESRYVHLLSITVLTPYPKSHWLFHVFCRQEAHIDNLHHCQRTSNRIRAHVRTSAARTQEDFKQLCNDLHVAWSSIVHTAHPTKPPADQELRAVFVLGDITAAWEAGFAVPTAGQDAQWARDNMAAFKQRASGGDADFADLVAELESREEFK